MFLEISQNSQENTYARVWRRCSTVNFAKFLRTAFFTEHDWVTASEPFMTMQWFSIYLRLIFLDLWKSFEYALGSKYLGVLNMQQLRTVLDTLECARKFISIPKYVWILPNKQATEYKMTFFCYLVALSNAENQLFIDGRA